MEGQDKHHMFVLQRLCRVCGYTLTKGGKSTKQYQCADNKEALQTSFGIDVSKDKTNIHPASYCHPCSSVMYFKKKAEQQQREDNHTRRVFDWKEHAGGTDNCMVCSELTTIRAGRPRKPKRSGRPANISQLSAIKHIKSVAPPPLTTRNDIIIIEAD